uniref:Uncharacterized protein n=1 Tax=Arundo donax TaxID=35708 RepID=A0A0A9GD75_ARUDO
MQTCHFDGNLGHVVQISMEFNLTMAVSLTCSYNSCWPWRQAEGGHQFIEISITLQTAFVSLNDSCFKLQPVVKSGFQTFQLALGRLVCSFTD